MAPKQLPEPAIDRCSLSAHAIAVAAVDIDQAPTADPESWVTHHEPGNAFGRGGGSRLWWFQGRGRQRSMGRISLLPKGMGPIFPISSSIVARIRAVPVAPHSSI
jgi:hypothetical protein